MARAKLSSGAGNTRAMASLPKVARRFLIKPCDGFYLVRYAGLAGAKARTPRVQILSFDALRSHFDSRSRSKDRNRNPRHGVGLRPKLRISCLRPDEFDTRESMRAGIA